MAFEKCESFESGFGRLAGIPSKKRPRSRDRRNQEINSIMAFFD